MRHFALVAIALVLSACAINSSVTRSSDKQFNAKPPSCNIEFFRTQRPATPYDEIGAIHLAGGVIHSAQDAQEALRSKACELGADAVIITDEVYEVPNVGLRVTGTAVAYRKADPSKQPASADTVGGGRDVLGHDSAAASTDAGSPMSSGGAVGGGESVMNSDAGTR